MKTLVILVVVLFVAWTGIRIYNAVIFEKDCGGYLKRAADANTVELAKGELSKVLAYMERHDLTEGYTSVVYRTPDEDIGFWYTNLKNSYQGLAALNPDTTPLEESSMLIKLRETILDEGSHISVTSPAVISMYPYNGTMAILGVILLLVSLVLVVGGVLFLYKEV